MPIERPRNDPSWTRVFGASRRFSISHLPIPSRVVSWQKPNQIPHAHFKGSAWLLAKYQREYFLCNVTPHRAIFLFIIGSTSNFRNPSCAHLLWVIDQAGLGFPEGEIGFLGLLWTPLLTSARRYFVWDFWMGKSALFCFSTSSTRRNRRRSPSTRTPSDRVHRFARHVFER